jgi:hypothetical protein
MMIETRELGHELTELKQSNPQGYGYIKRYWEEAQQGLDNTNKNYARVTHIYENITDPTIGTRGLGQTLVLLAQLNVLTVLTNRSNATIYDLTAYDPDRLTAIGHLLNDP